MTMTVYVAPPGSDPEDADWQPIGEVIDTELIKTWQGPAISTIREPRPIEFTIEPSAHKALIPAITEPLRYRAIFKTEDGLPIRCPRCGRSWWDITFDDPTINGDETSIEATAVCDHRKDD